MGEHEPALLEAARGGLAAGGPALTAWASCAGGCEPEAAAELSALGWRAYRLPAGPAGSGETAGLGWERGTVYGIVDVATAYRTLWAARTVTRVTLLLALEEVGSLDDIGRLVRRLDLRALPLAPFAVRAERHGDHAFRSPDLARVTGQAVIDRYAGQCGRRLPVDLDEPTTVVRAELRGPRLRVGLELSAHSLHRRPYLPFRHHAALKATVAASLLAMVGWRRDQRLLDPMCGGGTIVVEAGMAACRQPPHAGAPTRLSSLALHRPDLACRVAAELHAGVVPPAPGTWILGLERYGHHVAGARRNLAAADLSGAVEVRRGDATRLDGLGAVDIVVVNPPFGMRAGSPRILEPLYTRALVRVGERLDAGGRLLLLSPARQVVARAAAAAGLVLLRRRTVSLGTFDACAHLYAPPRH